MEAVLGRILAASTVEANLCRIAGRILRSKEMPFNRPPEIANINYLNM